MQEKVSTIIPSKSTDNKVAINAEKSQDLVLSSDIKVDLVRVIERNSPQNQIVVEPSLLDELALSVQQNLDIEIKGTDAIITQALEVGDNWNVITKEDEILETAKEFLGVKYVWAANGPSSFDCSGYTKYVFKKNGITLPRYSGHQARVGTKVEFSELEKGDLVFFDTEKHHTGKVNHVGIYVGNHKFIHASSGAKKVMITSFDKKEFYKKSFLHGQRVVNSGGSYASLHSKKLTHRN